jgi:hypothetical protein
MILESQPFRTSKQCQDLLRYIVSHSTSGDDTALKERIIGTEVFGRKPAYDTNEDPVVRVRAADVRKRLAQYYQSLEPGSSLLHIELLPGSYRAHFSYSRQPQGELVPVTLTPADASPARLMSSPTLPGKSTWLSSRRGKIIAALAVVLAITGSARWIYSVWPTPQQRFWAPLTTANQPVLIYLGANAAYVFSPEFLAKYRAAHGMPYNGPEFFVDLPPGSTVSIDDLRAERDTFVTTADVTAIVQLTTFFRDWKSPFVLRSGSDLSFGDIRNRPSVMIGGFNNPWTIELTNDLPFRFRRGVEIENRDHPERSWSVVDDPSGNATDDYALITRLLSSKTGGPVITVAGIGQSGTQAAAEFLTNPDRMRDLLKAAPPGWENKNMEAVLHVKVVGFQPVEVDVAATTYW